MIKRQNSRFWKSVIKKSYFICQYTTENFETIIIKGLVEKLLLIVFILFLNVR